MSIWKGSFTHNRSFQYTQHRGYRTFDLMSNLHLRRKPMSRKISNIILVTLVSLAVVGTAFGHGGRLDRSGGHNDRKRGTYHCHRAPCSSKRATQPQRSTWKKKRTSSKIRVNTQVKAIQTHLNRLGYSAGTPDGRMGPMTRAAIRKYQTDHGMTANGQPSASLLSSLKQQ